MPSIPSVVALAPIVLVPGEDLVATADVRTILPTSDDGALLESVVAVTQIVTAPSGLSVGAANEATFDSSSISFWVEAATAAHGAKYTITITFKTRAAGGPIDGSEDRTRKVVCPIVVREKDF